MYRMKRVTDCKLFNKNIISGQGYRIYILFNVNDFYKVIWSQPKMSITL